MTENRWVYHLADALFLRGGFSEPIFDPGTDGLVTLPDERFPDVLRERCDPLSPSKRRQATTQEIAAVEDARRDADIDGLLAAKAIARVAWEHRPVTDPTTWVQWWAEVKTRYRQAQSL